MILAADVGGTNIRMAILDAQYRIIDEHRIQAQLSTMQANSAEQAQAMLCQLLCDSFAPLIAQHRPTRIGIGFPGFFDGDSGILLASPNIPQLQHFNLAAAIFQQTQLPTYVQNDALCAAFGEFHHGIGNSPSITNLLHITLGTGVGAGLILNHSPYSGEHGMAMEFGHLQSLPLDGDEVLPCGCGNRGCLETFASATALSRRYLALSGKHATAQQVALAANQQDTAAVQVIRHAGLYLGAAIAEASKLLDIKTISISGGMTGCWDLLAPAMEEALQSQLIPPLRGKISIYPSKLGDNAGLFGAARLNRG